jgi:hypothetical protein
MFDLEGGVRLPESTIRLDDVLSYTVRCAIEPGHLGRVFDPFFTSRLGQGTTFTWRFP